MTDFADVEQFGHQHASHGGLTPSATPQPGGGFVLRLTCACGESFDRRVTPEEAKQPLPQIPLAPRGAPASTPAAPATSPPPPTPPRPPTSQAPPREVAPPPSRRRGERPRVTPSPELEDALRAALEAESGTVVHPSAPPSPSKTAPPADLKLYREALAAEEAAASSPPATRPAAPPASPAGPRRERHAVTRLDLDVTIREALDRQRADAAEPREAPEPPATRRIGLVLLVVALLGAAGGGAYWYLSDWSEEEVETTASSGPKLPSEQGAALAEVVKSLRQVQSSTPPDSTFPVYSSRVLVGKTDVEKFAQSSAPQASRTSAREFMELHLLATSTLRARSLDRKDVWETLSRDPTLSLCPDVKTVLERASQTGSVSPDEAKAAAVSAALPKMWECARARLGGLERLLAEQR